MAEHIYTIMINEVFESCEAGASASGAKGATPCTCPICALRERLEKNELERIMGAAMMEPNVRIETNKAGFCRRHFDDMLGSSNRLGLALILESHLAEVERGLRGSITDIVAGRGAGASGFAEDTVGSCYLCGRVGSAFDKVIDNLFYMWGDRDFRAKFAAQKSFCLPHYALLTEKMRKGMPKKEQAEFYSTLKKVMDSYLSELRSDISLFCKKFDYRFDDLPWGNAKDAPERATRFLSGKK